jgi:hypothetical protein
MANQGLWILAVTTLCGCSDAGVRELDSTEATELADGSLGESTQALNESAVDRQQVAAIVRMTPSENQLWVFACDSNNMMRRRVKYNNYRDPSTSEWTSWFTVGNGRTCASPPTLGKWEWNGYVPGGFEAMGAYWRDLNNHLMEAWYNEDGTSMVTDLSDYLGFGPIQGTPAVANISNTDSAAKRISVAVIKAGAAGELYTLDFYSGSWHVKPILLSNGTIANASPGASFVTQFGGAAGKSLISMQLNFGAHFIYARERWTPSYTQFAWTTVPDAKPLGVLSFTNTFWSIPAWGNFGCLSYTCAVLRDPVTNRPKFALLDVGGNISSSFISFASVQQFGQGALMGGSVSWSGGFIWDSTGNARSYLRTNEGHAAEFTTDYGVVKDLGGSNLSSAPVPTLFDSRHYFYTAGASNTVFYHEIEHAGQPHINLGLSTLAP